MAELTPEQKKIIEQQKKQCPFCQIIAGKIPSKKVYEDDKVIAILDINPANKGHCLVMPKEHYPIMPLIPQDTFRHLFKIVRDMSKILKKSLLMTGTNVFIANGAAAGQQSAHFMVHIIPREKGDGVSGLNLKENKVDEVKLKELEEMLKHNLPLMLQEFYKKHPIEGKEEAMPKMSKEQVIKILEQNPQIIELIKTKPDTLKQAIPGNAQLKALFDNVNFDEIVEHFTGVKEADFEDVEESEDKDKKEKLEEQKESDDENSVKDELDEEDSDDNELSEEDSDDNELSEEDSDDNELSEEDSDDNELDEEDSDDNELSEEDSDDNELSEEDSDEDIDEKESSDDEDDKDKEKPKEGVSLDDIARLFG